MRFYYALTTFLFALSSAERIAGRDGLWRRQDNSVAATTTGATPSSTERPSSTSPAPTESTSRTNSNHEQTTAVASQTDSRGGDVDSVFTTTGTAKNLPSVTSTPRPADTSTTRAHQLPIRPKINPPVGIAGVILMLAGLVLGFVGIKHRGTQTFLSTALLVALGIEVLVVYLMNPPVPVAIQAAYLIAGVLGGGLVGGAMLVFKEVSEGFGCVLGGFCFAMWLLVLSPGGLIKSSVGKIILIAMLCAACYCLYISRFTRVYGIIFCTSLAGATAFVLGLDCFSKAGLKEFWLYIWDLNDNEFPLFTDTYPITRPMRAEIAAIIIIAFLGSMSQVKIWKVVKEQKARRDAQRIEDEEARDALEEEVGRDVENRNRQSLTHWEGNYDGKKMQDVTVHDSGVGSIDDSYYESSVSQKRRSYPLVQIRPATSDEFRPEDRGQSSLSLNLSTSGKRASAVPSIPELNFNFNAPYHDEATGSTAYVAAHNGSSASLVPASPGLSVPEAPIKDRRNVEVKRLSIQSLLAKEALDAAQDEELGTPMEEASVIGSSIAATAPDGIADDLSIAPDRHSAMYMQWAQPSTPDLSQDQFAIDEDDDDVVGPFGRKSMNGSTSKLPATPGTPGSAQKSDVGASTADEGEKVELRDRLPKKASKAAMVYRTNEWAKEVSRAEPEPLPDVELNDPEAVRIDIGDAAEAARAEENNAAPKPLTPPPPPPAPLPKSVADKARRSSTHLVKNPSGVAPTPIYAHKAKHSDDSWSVPLAKRASSQPVLAVEAGATPLDVRNASGAILEEPIVPLIKRASSQPMLAVEASATSPGMRSASGPILEQTIRESPAENAVQRRISTVPSLPNLLDERRERLEKRLTTTSFMTPNAGLGLQSAQKSPEGSAKGEGSQEGSHSRKQSSSDRTNDEDMTLAERKALVQRQSALQAQNAAEAARPLNSRQASGYFAEVRPPKPVRMTSNGHQRPLYDSHQPRRMSSHDANKQASNWSQWRTSQQVATVSRDPYTIGDNQQDMLRAMRVQHERDAKLREQQKQVIQQQIDAHARMGGLNDAHQRALAKMQQKANKSAQ